MTNEEKWFCLDHILQGIRNDWSGNLKPRVKKARQLAEELGYTPTVELINEFEYDDGRHFRTSFAHGGYEGMSEMHKLKPLLLDKSDECQNILKEYTHYCYFEDAKPFVGKYGDWNKP